MKKMPIGDNQYHGFVQAIIGAVIGIGGVAVDAVDKGKRRQFEAAVGAMSTTEQRDLNRKFAEAKTQSDKVKLILDTVAEKEAEEERQKSKTKNLLIIGTISIVLVGLIVYSIKK